MGHSNTFTNEGGLKSKARAGVGFSRDGAPEKSLRELSRSWALLAQISYGARK
jgi:hypothetical protein